MIRSMSARDALSSPPAQVTPSSEVESDETASGSLRLFNRLVTTSAVAAALAQVQEAEVQVGLERSKRRRLDRRHSGGLEPLIEAGKEPSEALPTPNGHRLNVPIIESVPEIPVQVTTKPIRLGNASPRGQLKRGTSSHLAGFRGRIKGTGQATFTARNAIKRAPSASTMPTFKRIPSTTTFRSTTFDAAVSSNGQSEQGQNYEQMMARFQLRRLEPADSQRSINSEVQTLHRRNTAYMRPVDSELSQRRMDDRSSRPRSEGEAIDSTMDRKADGDLIVTSQSRVDSRDESPRRPGAPSFHSDTENKTPPATATVSPEGFGGSINGTIGGSMRSFTNTVKNVQSTTTPEQEPVHSSQLGEKQQTIAEHQSKARTGSGGASVLNQTSRKLTSRPTSRPRLLPRLKKRVRAFLFRLCTPLSPFSRTARVRSFFLLAAFCFHALWFPYELAFHAGGRAWFMCADSVTEMIFLADFLLAFNTSFVNNRGVLVVSRRHIAWNFFTGAFVFQLGAATPVMTASLVMKGGAENVAIMELNEDAFKQFSHTLIDFLIRSHRIAHLLRLQREVGHVRDARIDKSVLGWLLYSRYSHLFRITWIVGAVMLIAHCVACCWRLLVIDSARGNPASIIGRTCGAPFEANAELKVYAECFYVSMQMLQGQSLTTYSARENVFASCVNLLGSIVLAVIFGHVAMLVANFNANSTAYQRKMESVFAGMSKMQLPAPLRERIHQYYAHLWREYEALDGAPLERFAKELSHNLTLEVVLFKYMELAMHVPFWENCSPDFQKTLVLSLDTRVYLPDDFIVRRGEVGDEFYMINRGMCELVGSKDTFEHATEPLARRRSRINEHSEHPADTSTLYTTSHDGTVYPDRDDPDHSHSHRRGSSVSPDGVPPSNSTVKSLTRGQAFGEMALLMNYQRTANVRAMTYVEMCVLSRTAFQAVLTRYPADRKHVIYQILISTLENNELFGTPCPLTAMVRSVFAEEVNNTEKFITPRRAAKLIAWAVNPDVEDDSIKFALGSKLKEQLVVVRDQEVGVLAQVDDGNTATSSTSEIVGDKTSLLATKMCSDVNTKRKDCGCACNCHHSVPNALPISEPEVDSQVMKLEGVQAQALALIQELHLGVQGTLFPPPVQPKNEIIASVLHQNSVAASETPASRRKPLIRGTSTKNMAKNIQQRRLTFIRNRSLSAPNFADLDDNDTNMEQGSKPSEPSAKSKPPAARPKPIQRAMTSRWLKTSESNRPLRNPTAFTPLARPRGVGSSSQRFIQRVTNQLASLATSNSTVQASPTRYADQLFGAAQSGLDTAPSVNEMSFRDDSNVSEARY